MSQIKNEDMTTEEHFQLFQNECLKWLGQFGLKDWTVCFSHEELKDETLAQCASDYSNCIATLLMQKNWKGEEITEYTIRRIAFHEVMELLVSDLAKLASSRFIQEDELSKTRHMLIKRLENGVFTAAEAE